jgi:hypothetical protein
MSGITGETNATTGWAAVCGGASSPASLAAINVAQQNVVGGAQVASANINVYYGTSSGVGTETDCSALTAAAAFAVNPVVEVSVQQPKLPTFFARVFALVPNGTFSNSGVTATAAAEAFNPSGEGGTIPVQPRCVKPWMVPNLDPLNGSNCTINCKSFVDPKAGGITNQGIFPEGSGVIGETFWLTPDCRHNGTTCSLRISPPEANYPQGVNPYIPPPPNLDYLPGEASYASTAVPADGTDACRTVKSATDYAQAIAGCDQTTQYQCGQASQNVIDLGENPGQGDTTNGVECLIHQAAGTSDTLSKASALGQDLMLPEFAPPPSYPFQIEPGSSNPLLNAGVKGTDLITSSTSIVSLPIYDSSAPNLKFTPGNKTNVTVIGFLQVFINFVDGNGNLNVTVMNVAGCGNNASNTPLNGTSPVPIRLITPPVASGS